MEIMRESVKKNKAQPFHTLSAQEVIAFFNTSLENGLTEQEAELRLKNYGPNRIASERTRSLLRILLDQFKSPIVFLLLFAVAVSFVFKEWIDGIAILVVLLLNTAIGFYMELQAHRSMTALKKLSAFFVRVLRDGHLKEINAENLVPGDIVFSEAGEMVGADGRIFKFSQLQADESALTGESIPVEKTSEVIGSDTILSDRINMLYKGTIVSKGNAWFIITATGMETELGRVAHLVQKAEPATAPLEEKLKQFSKKLIKITVVLVVIIFVSGILYGKNLMEMLQTSVALAVAAIPEGLPIVATLALAQGMMKIARYKVIVKRLSAIETLGGTTIICTDKTGTITKNKIEVSKILSSVPEAEEEVLRTMVLCNTADMDEGKTNHELGDPLETGLLRYAVSVGLSVKELRKTFPKKGEEPFSSETRVMSTLHKMEENEIVYAKGAVEEILKRCTGIGTEKNRRDLNEEKIEYWLKEAERLSSSGLKVIATAFKINDASKELGKNLLFTGLIGMMDPPREEVFAAIEECRSAGVKIVMITGDHPATAANIALQTGIVKNLDSPVLTGRQMKSFNELNENEKQHWSGTQIFARVSPEQKLDIISVLQERKNVVAMTGDGINDAPALKKADIGIAMGERGTQAAQEVADMVLKNDSFASIVVAVKQGRIIFANIRKFVLFLLSCNLSEIMVISAASILNLYFQLFPLQILFINLITDVLPALALGVTEGSPDIMKEPPRTMDEPVVDKKRWMAIFIYSAVISGVSIGAVYFSQFTIHGGARDANHGNNLLFFTLILAQLFHVFNMGDKAPFYKSEVFRNKKVWLALAISLFIVTAVYLLAPAKAVLSLQEMPYPDWAIAIGFSLLGLILVQILKKLRLVI